MTEFKKVGLRLGAGLVFWLFFWGAAVSSARVSEPESPGAGLRILFSGGLMANFEPCG